MSSSCTLHHRLPRCFTLAGALSAALLVVALLLTAVPAFGEGTAAPRAFVGKVVTSAMPLTPGGDEDAFFGYLKERDQATIARPADGPWPIYLIAFFGQPIGASECHVAVYSLKTKKPSFVEAFGQRVTAEQDNLSTHIELSPDRFSPGSYELRVTRLVGGKEKVYARTTITLK